MTLSVRMPDGSRLAAGDACVLGRSPERPGHAPVALPDHERVTSKSHLTIRRCGAICEVIDLHSTNGTALGVGESWVLLPPGVATHVTVPFRIDCGGVIVDVEFA